MSVVVAFLRAVNVGGKGAVKMPALKALCEREGFTAVATLLQSGNVVFDAGRLGPAKVEAKLRKAIAETFGFDTTVMVRKAADLAAIVKANPFPAAARDDPGHLVVLFLAEKPDAGVGIRLAAIKAGPERMKFVGSELFVHYRAGIGKSKLTNAVIEKALGGIAATGRNWNTVLKLLAMTQAAAADE